MSDQENIPVFERRKSDPLMILLTELREGQVEIHKQLEAHRAEVPTRLSQALEQLVADAFPESDPDGHRRHHEVLIRKAEVRAEFWQKINIELAKYGLIGFIGWAVIALWQKFLTGPHP